MVDDNNEQDRVPYDDDNSSGLRKTNRRKFLATAVGAAPILFAGCSGAGGGGDDDTDETEASGDADTEADDGSSGSTTTESSGDGVNIGLLTHLSGRFGFAGKTIQNSVEMVVEEARSTGGILGQEIEITTFDTKAEPQRALQGFETLAAEDVDVILGPSSASIPNLLEPAQERGLPIISPTAGSTFLDTRGGEYVWRTTQSDSLNARPQPLYASEQGWDSMSVAYLDNRGSQSFGKSIQSFFEEQRGTVIEEMALAPDANSYRSEIQTLADGDPDVIHVTMSEDTFPLFIQNYRELGIDIRLMGGNEVTTSGMIDSVGADAMEEVIGVRTVPVDNYSAFSEKYQEAIGEEPGIFAPEAYDMINLVALAWENAGSVGREEIVNNISQVGNPEGEEVAEYSTGKEALNNGDQINYEGAATPCDFDESGNVFGPIAVAQVQDGEWTDIKVYSASELAETF